MTGREANFSCSSNAEGERDYKDRAATLAILIAGQSQRKAIRCPRPQEALAIAANAHADAERNHDVMCPAKLRPAATPLPLDTPQGRRRLSPTALSRTCSVIHAFLPRSHWTRLRCHKSGVFVSTRP